MRGLKIDAKAVVRGLTRRPVLLVAAVLCLALGIGANATMLRVLVELFFRPPALVARPGELRRLSFFLVIPDAGGSRGLPAGSPAASRRSRRSPETGVGRTTPETRLGGNPERKRDFHTS